MTDDYRIDDVELYPGITPRPYHFYKVKFIVFNKYTDEYNSMYFYVSAKKSLQWMTKSVNCPLPRTYFEYKYVVEEVEDDSNIIFHHITTKDDWERVVVKYFLTVCALSRWKVSWYHRVRRYIIDKVNKLPTKTEISFS